MTPWQRQCNKILNKDTKTTVVYLIHQYQWATLPSLCASMVVVLVALLLGESTSTAGCTGGTRLCFLFNDIVGTPESFGVVLAPGPLRSTDPLSLSAWENEEKKPKQTKNHDHKEPHSLNNKQTNKKQHTADFVSQTDRTSAANKRTGLKQKVYQQCFLD